MLASVEGKLASVGVPRLFRAIADEGRTGRLSLTHSGHSTSDEAEVYFRSGNAYHARLMGSGVQLGTRLISAGVLAHSDIDNALEIQKSEGRIRRLGEILVQENLISQDHLERVVKEQIEDTIFEILKWEDGIWTFDSDVESSEDIGLTVSVENLVMEGARRFREWHQISKVVPSLEATPLFTAAEGAPIEVALTPEEWAFVSRVDGQTTIIELSRLCGFTEMETARTAAGLISAGLLELVLPEGVEAHDEDEELDQVFDELERALEEAASGKEGSHDPITLEEIVASSGGKLTPDSTSLDFEISNEEEELPTLDDLPVIPEEERSNRTDQEPIADPQYTSVFDTPSVPEPVQQFEEPIEQIPEPFQQFEEPVEQIPEPFQQFEEPVEQIPEPIQQFEPIEQIPEPIQQFEPIEQIPEPIQQFEEPVSLETSPVNTNFNELQVSGFQEDIHSGALNGNNGFHVKDPGANIVAEEQAEISDKLELTSIAQMFADLAKPFDGPDVKSVQENTSPPQPPKQNPISPPASTKDSNEAAWQRSTPVDPDVDVRSLIREFSALGSDEENDAHDFSNPMENRTRPSSREADKGRGLFGKKRK